MSRRALIAFGVLDMLLALANVWIIVAFASVIGWSALLNVVAIIVCSVIAADMFKRAGAVTR